MLDFIFFCGSVVCVPTRNIDYVPRGTPEITQTIKSNQMSKRQKIERKYFGFSDWEFIRRFRVAYVRECALLRLQRCGASLSALDLYNAICEGVCPRSVRFFRHSFGTRPGWALLYLPFSFTAPTTVILHHTTKYTR